MKKIVITGALLASVAAATSANAARVLYAYADRNGNAAIAVTPGFVPADDRDPQYGYQQSKPITASCISSHGDCATIVLVRLDATHTPIRFIDQNGYRIFDRNLGGSTNPIPYNQVGTYTVNTSDFAQMAVYQLADDDIVLGYANSSGTAAVAIAKGFDAINPIAGTGVPRTTPLSTVLCFSQFTPCGGIDLYSGRNGTSVAVEVSNADGSLVKFDSFDANWSTPGSYVQADGAGQKLLTIVGPLTSPASPAVPEPATWAMMLVGVGAVGSAMRRRKRIATDNACAA